MDKTYKFMGELASALHSKKITITISSLRSIINEKKDLKNFSPLGARGIGSSISSAYDEWTKIGNPTVADAIAETYMGADGKPAHAKK